MNNTFLIFLIVISCISCNVNKIEMDNLPNNLYEKNISSYSANYLAAHYSISKGDAYTASKILDEKIKNTKLLQLKFFSNLMSGKFESAEKVSQKLRLHNINKDIYLLPEYILKIKRNDLRKSLKIFENKRKFFNLDNLNYLIKFWINEADKKDNLIHGKHFKQSSIHELLILENFHNSKKLTKIADLIYNKSNLNSHDLLLLAGFYYRVKNINKFNNIIKKQLSGQFDKLYIINHFMDTDNMYNKVPNLHVILASKIYNIINKNNFKVGKQYSYQKILLEFSLYLNPKMDISRYSLAEIYNFEETNEIAMKKLDFISDKSFFSLAANLKQLAIIKSEKVDLKYKTLLFRIFDIWPENKFVLYRLANYYKSKEKYSKSLKIYKKILKDHKSTDRDLFLYASNLDKIGKWNEAKELFLQLLKKNPKDTYTLNYLSYKLALKEQELELALNLIKKALVLDPENGYFLDTLGWVEFKRKNYNSAVYFLEKSVSILPKSSEVMDHLGDCYLMLNRKKEAFFEWNKALKYETDTNKKQEIKDKLNKYGYLL